MCALLLPPYRADNPCYKAQGQLTVKPRAVYQLQRVPGLGNDNLFSKSPAIINKPIFRALTYEGLVLMSHVSLPHPSFPCAGQNTSHPVLVTQVLHTGPSHPSRLIRQAMGRQWYFYTANYPSVHSLVHDKFFISPMFSSVKCFPSPGQGCQGCPRAGEPWAGNPPRLGMGPPCPSGEIKHFSEQSFRKGIFV